MASAAAIPDASASAISSLWDWKDHFSGDSMTPSSDTSSDATTFLIETPFVCRVVHRLLGAYGNSLENHHRFEILQKFKWDGSGGLAEILRPWHTMSVPTRLSRPTSENTTSETVW